MVANSMDARLQRMNDREQYGGLRRRTACGKRASPPPLPTVLEAPVLPDPIHFEDGSIGFRARDQFTALNFLWDCADCAPILALAHVPCGFLFDTVTKHGENFNGIHTAIMTKYGANLDLVEEKYGLPFTVQHVKVLCKGFLHNDTCSRVKSLKDMLKDHSVASVSDDTLVQLALKNFDGRSLLSWKPTKSIPSFSHFCTEMSLVKLTIPDDELQALETLRARCSARD